MQDKRPREANAACDAALDVLRRLMINPTGVPGALVLFGVPVDVGDDHVAVHPLLKPVVRMALEHRKLSLGYECR